MAQDSLSDLLLTMPDPSSVLNADSLAPATAGHVKESLFSDHLLPPSTPMQEQPRNVPDNDFAFLTITICAMLIIYLQRTSDGIVQLVFNGSFDSRLAFQEARVENAQRIRNLLLMQVVALISVSLFLTAALRTILTDEGSLPTLFFRILIGALAWLLIKKGVQWILAQLFGIRHALRLYHFNTNLLFSACGLLLLPITLIAFFSPQLPYQVPLYTGASVAGLFYLKGLQRGLSIALRSASISPLHLFYYLCALEILPVFVLIRIAQNL